ncbi:MAG: carboxypeptidase-like regulatory domain-containing protein [Prevotella sp.]|jgi:hypothetical protein|nr:carboxypeptidase-like regulatory domain-containing protein [Prevotella sp.]
MKRILILLFCITCFVNIHSQKITGAVYDDTTKEPISDVSVYLNGTTYHTSTNSKGEFVLTFDKKIRTNLIISHVGYNTISASDPYEGMPEKIYLTQKNILDEVIVDATKNKSKRKKFSRGELLRMFRNEFLGKSKAAQSSKIKNQKEIILIYDYPNERLHARCENPIIIENQYLGYKINFQLFNFYSQYSGSSFNSFFKEVLGAANNTICMGTASFEDISAENNEKIKERRDATYKDSRNYFFKNLISNSLTNKGFEMYIEQVKSREDTSAITNMLNKVSETSENDSYVLQVKIRPEEYFKIEDALSVKKVTLSPPPTDSLTVTSYMGQKVYGWLGISNNEKRSRLLLLRKSFYVDQFGSSYTTDQYGDLDYDEKILFSGGIGDQRAGDILPLDYEPDQKSD